MEPKRFPHSFALALCGIALIGFLAFSTSRAPLIFSPPQVLHMLWFQYKKNYIDPDTARAVDHDRDGVTTSEGQSYSMLRAVWMDDKEAFDAAWKWARENLEREDGLFAWIYGERPDGTFGILTAQGGNTTASDADTDIALALVFAYARWQDPGHLSAARRIADAIWEKEVVNIRGTYYLASNDREKTLDSPSILVNPSYLHPAAYRIFARIDPEHPWNRLVDDSYALIERSIDAPLGGEPGKLAPDWVRVHRQTGALLPPGEDLSIDFGFEALRLPFRIALDSEWFGAPRAKEVLGKLSFLSESWRADGVLHGSYAHAGAPAADYETSAMYGGAIGYFVLRDPPLAREVYEKKLISLFDPGASDWRVPQSYYDDNWAWFGIALYHHLLPNLAAAIPAKAL